MIILFFVLLVIFIVSLIITDIKINNEPNPKEGDVYFMVIGSARENYCRVTVTKVKNGLVYFKRNSSNNTFTSKIKEFKILYSKIN